MIIWSWLVSGKTQSWGFLLKFMQQNRNSLLKLYVWKNKDYILYFVQIIKNTLNNVSNCSFLIKDHSYLQYKNWNFSNFSTYQTAAYTSTWIWQHLLNYSSWRINNSISAFENMLTKKFNKNNCNYLWLRCQLKWHFAVK